MRALQLLCAACCVVAVTASADVIEIDVTVKAVDAKARKITVARNTAKGERVKTLDVARKAGEITELTEGQAVSITYDPELGIVAKVTPSVEKPSADAEGDSGPSTVEMITPEEAKTLTAESGLLLSLPRLRKLSPEAAEQLATYREQSKTATDTVMVPVCGEKTMTYTVMVSYAEDKTRDDGTKYTINKCRPEERKKTITFTKMVPEKVNRTCPFTLQFDGLESAEPRTLAELAKHVGNLHLNGLKALSREQAQSLAAHKGGMLALDGLASLDAGTAEVLAAHEGALTLNGLESLSPESAKALGGHKGDLSLDGVNDLTDDVANTVVAHQGLVSLKGVKKTSDKAKEILAGWAVSLPPEIRAEWQKEKE